MIITQKVNSKCDKILAQQLATAERNTTITAILKLNVPDNTAPVPLASQFNTRNGWRRALINRNKYHIEKYCGKFLKELESDGLLTDAGIRPVTPLISRLVIISGPAYLVIKSIGPDIVEFAWGDQQCVQL